MQKFKAIESLRGWMAWWVVTGHALQLIGGADLYFPGEIAIWVSQGKLAVQVFMIVSGFVITHLLVSQGEGYRDYILRRWFRLVPLFVTVTVISVSTRIFYVSSFISNPWAQGAEVRLDRLVLEKEYWLPHLLAHLSLLHGLIPNEVLEYAGSTFLSPAWSLSLEWQFYLIAPVLLLAMTRLPFAWIAIAAVVVSVPAARGLFGHWQYQSFLLIALPFFFGGITSRLLLDRRIPWLAGSLTVLSTLAYIEGYGLGQIKLLLVVAAIWFLFFFITARESGVIEVKSRLLDAISWLVALNPVSTALGRISYSTYLAHIPIFAIVIGSGIMLAGSADRETIVIFTLAAVALTLPASFAFYRYIEQPGIRLGNLWVRKRPVDRFAAA